MSDTARLDYEALVAQYEQDLATQLRSFRPAHDFLEMWVHDADPAKSVLNLVEAAQAGGLRTLDVTFGANTLDRLDPARLQSLLAPLGQAHFQTHPGGAVLHVEL